LKKAIEKPTRVRGFEVSLYEKLRKSSKFANALFVGEQTSEP